ncbi:MAG: MBL fold metallo-hydrolase [Caldilinea sp. CFX5]|nr:MBL fold metallo-hydrolase [Caldilinea sp. CFX5]
MTTNYTRINDVLLVHHGCCNVGIIRDGERALLIDAGNGDVQATLTALGITTIDRILFTAAEISQMRANLAERVACYGQLFPWDHPNYGLDEQWVRCEPYEQPAQPGTNVTITVVVTNHSATAKMVHCQPILPTTWPDSVSAQQAMIPPSQEGQIIFAITIPALAPVPSGEKQQGGKRIVIPVEITYDSRALGQFREAILIFV